jgi:hypothetical protein
VGGRRAHRARWLVPVAAAAIALLIAGCFPAKAGPPGFGAHHDDPYLTCVRRYESGGRYTVDSPNGLYHGAYQFHQATWDDTARHIGRRDLVGLDPHVASPALQDDMAWALYQWRGKAPWAGIPC